MSFQQACLKRLERAFAAWEDLLGTLPEAALAQELPAPSNSIGAQLWCLIGARESYTRAIAAGGWQGFSCSLTAAEINSSASILEALVRSANIFRESVIELDWDEARCGLALDLLEHEAQHQGQLIRYIYALGLEFPPSWKARWSLD